MKQTSFASLAFTEKKRQTRRERFLAEMEAVVPWSALLAVIEPHYPPWRPAHRAFDDAEDLLHAAMVAVRFERQG
jgi:hypothetical protein